MKVEYFTILTVMQPAGRNQEYLTLTDTLRIANATRAGLYQYMRNQLPERLRNANTLFFSAEPNRRSVS